MTQFAVRIGSILLICVAATQVVAGPRGGAVIIFETFELPLISEVKFEGLKDVAESVMLDDY